jgi:hypothetical protein
LSVTPPLLDTMPNRPQPKENVQEKKTSTTTHKRSKKENKAHHAQTLIARGINMYIYVYTKNIYILCIYIYYVCIYIYICIYI